MMRAMDGSARPTKTSSAIFVISITGTTKITVPAGPEAVSYTHLTLPTTPYV